MGVKHQKWTKRIYYQKKNEQKEYITNQPQILLSLEHQGIVLLIWCLEAHHQAQFLTELVKMPTILPIYEKLAIKIYQKTATYLSNKKIIKYNSLYTNLNFLVVLVIGIEGIRHAPLVCSKMLSRL